MTKWITTQTYGKHRVAYHTDRDCQTIQGTLIRVPESVIEVKDLHECKHCAGTAEKTHTQPYRECPLCGEMVGKLPNHIRKAHE